MAAAALVDGAARGAVRTPVYFLSHGGVGAGLSVPLKCLTVKFQGCLNVGGSHMLFHPKMLPEMDWRAADTSTACMLRASAINGEDRRWKGCIMNEYLY